MPARFMVSVVGGHECGKDIYVLAEKTGEVIARSGSVLVCGGLGGVMEACCRGAQRSGGLTVGMIPGEDKDKANDFVDIVIATGMGYSRNTLVAGTADMVVALPGEYGTLSEIAFALNGGKPVYGIKGGWDIPGMTAIGGVSELEQAITEERSRWSIRNGS